MATLQETFARLWATSRSLTTFGVAMFALAAITAPMILTDPTAIDDQLRWIKPTKFAVAFVLYAFTVAWILSYAETGRLRRWVARVLAATGAVEMMFIAGQALRGKTSHFNNETVFDGVLFGIMGAVIVVFFVANLIAVVLAMRSRIADRVLAIGLRLGFAVASIGMLEGTIMLLPTPEQSAELASGREPARLGSHDFGAGGDLRPAHFFGMHGLQAIPLFAAAVRRRRRWSEPQKLRSVWTGAIAYASLFGLLTLQALRGQPLLQPDAATLGILTTILFASCLAFFIIDQQPASERLAEAVQ